MKMIITQTATITREIDVLDNMPIELALAKFGMIVMDEDRGITVADLATGVDSSRIEVETLAPAEV